VELDNALQEAQRLIFDEGTHVRLDSLPGPDATTTELDICIMALVLLKGEKNMKLPSVGSEQYAIHSAPQNFLLPTSDTSACGIASGEHATPVQHTNPCLEVLKLPDWNEPPLEEPGGVPLRLIHVAKKAGAEASKCVVVDACEPGKASLDAHMAPAPTEGITNVEPTSGAVEATAARPEALEPRAKNAEWSKLQLLLL
jgi:hypothetical protein